MWDITIAYHKLCAILRLFSASFVWGRLRFVVKCNRETEGSSTTSLHCSRGGEGCLSLS